MTASRGSGRPDTMSGRILMTIGILIYGLAVPILEVNETHLFNPEWTPHARLHEAWQLATNTSLAAYSLWLVWVRGTVRLPGILAIFVTGGFMLAYVFRGVYDGSMVLSDGSEKLVFGISIGVVGFGLVLALSIAAMLLESRRAIPAAP
jgi:hypothetical protein